MEHQVAEMFRADALRLLEAVGAAELDEPQDISSVALHRVRAVAGLEPQEILKPLDPEGPSDLVRRSGHVAV